MANADYDNQIQKLENKISSLKLDLKTKNIFNWGLIILLVFSLLSVVISQIRLVNERNNKGYSKEVQDCVEYERWKQNK